MGNNAKATSSSAVAVPDAQPVVIRPELMAAVELTMDGIPDAGGDALENIIGAILAVNDPRDLDAPWRTGALGELLNTRIRVNAIRKAPSDYAEGLPFFLLVDGVILETGEVFTATTGSVSVVMQLARAWQLNALPLTCIPREADRPSRSGYRPMHLEVVS